MATKKVTKPVSAMDELLKSSGYSFQSFKRGQTVVGHVKEVTSRTVFVDVEGKSDAIVSEMEYEMAKDYYRALKLGDEVKGVVLVTENENGHMVLSLRRAAVDQRWKQFEKSMAEETNISVKGKEATKGGLVVDADGMNGFIPTSQFGKDLEANTSTYIGKTFNVKIVEVDRLQHRLVLSERMVSESQDIESRKLMLSQVKIGGDYEGVVSGVVPFGAFVGVKVGKDVIVEGLVHISEISWEKIDEVTKILHEGDKTKVQVIGVDEETGKLALSIKRLQADPWSVLGVKYAIDSTHTGTVTKIVPYGVLVRVDKGIEGLIHASKMPANMSFKEGDELNVFVESIDLPKRRLSLGVVLSAKPVDYK